MQHKTLYPATSIILLFVFLLSACSAAVPAATQTNTPQPSATVTNTVVPTETSTPTRTPKPTATPNLAATQRRRDLEAEIQEYFDQGYLTTTKGNFRELDDFSDEWARLGYYDMNPIGVQATDFVLSGHFKWSSAYQNADPSG